MVARRQNLVSAPSQGRGRWSGPRIGPHWLLALVGFLAVALTLDVADDCSWSAVGPGVTFDEPFNVSVGVYLVESARQSGFALLHPLTWADIYNDPAYNPDHPPLARLALGAANSLLQRYDATAAKRPYVLTYARVGSAFAYGLVTWLVVTRSLRWHGKWAAWGAGLALFLLPRLFAHAHLASIETWMNLTYAAFVLVTAERWSQQAAPTAKDGWLPGLLLGLALLTKMQAIFLPPVFVVWALWHWRLKALAPIAVAGLVSLAVFVVGWPWLWPDIPGRMFDYFARSTERITLYCYYLGERYADRDVPWHYPWVMFVATTPLVWLVLGGWGWWAAANEARGVHAAESIAALRRWSLLTLSFLAPLIVFSLPGVTVYDGERLFLVVWPLWAVWCGRGFAKVCDKVGLPVSGAERKRWPPTRAQQAGALALLIGLASPVIALVQLHPCQLSYYSEVIGGLRGADRLGMEPTYWGDSVTPEFLRQVSAQVPEGVRIGVAPVLHPQSLTSLARDSWLRHRPDLQLVAYDDKQSDVPGFVLVIRRHADPWSSLSPPPEGTELLAREPRSGVSLAELLKLPATPAK